MLFLSALPLAAQAPSKSRWCSGPPVTLDFDMRDIPEPRERERSYYYDFLYATFGLETKQALDLPRGLRRLAGRPKEAPNVNCLGEVPDSSWYTNRNTKQPLSLEAIRRGSNLGAGPAPGEWKVIQGKSEGITPGFLIRDDRGEIYQLKFDPPDWPEMATAAEVIASKLYFAAGYNVKENYLVVFRRDRLKLAEDARLRDALGRSRPMTSDDLDRILSRVARRADGSFRAVAGKYLEGVAKGPFSFEGVRKDDPNDWIPHEHRRDLRGLRVFCSWVNENDFREGNTLDVYVTERGRRFLKHYLIDLGSSLGSETIHPNTDRVGNEYLLDFLQVHKSLLSLGLYRPAWKGRSRNLPHPAAGFLEAEIFDPGRWKPNYPVLPFENMTLQDAFWGARLVLSFTDDQIRAAVETGEFSDPRAAEFLAGVLIQRRDKIARHWLPRVNPLDRFVISSASDSSPELRFEDLELRHGLLAASERSYEYAVRDAHSGRVLQPRRSASAPVLPLSALLPRDSRLRNAVYQITIWTLRRSRRQGKGIDVYVAAGSESGELRLAGIRRED